MTRTITQRELRNGCGAGCHVDVSIRRRAWSTVKPWIPLATALVLALSALRIPDAAGGGVLLFATDGHGRVSEWRIGVLPQVDYVEGCS